MAGSDLIHNFAEVVTRRRYDYNFQVATLLFDADFIDGNIITMSIGNFDVPEVDFDTDNDTTFANLAEAIAGCPDVDSAIPDSNARTVTITSNKAGNELIFSDIIVTGGDDQASASVSKVGGYVDGVWQEPAFTDEEIEISIQPLNGHEILKLPDGDRTREWMKGYTAAEMHISDESSGAHGDYVLYNGRTFEVMKSERWMVTDLNHYKILMAEVNLETIGA